MGKNIKNSIMKTSLATLFAIGNSLSITGFNPDPTIDTHADVSSQGECNLLFPQTGILYEWYTYN